MIYFARAASPSSLSLPFFDYITTRSDHSSSNSQPPKQSPNKTSRAPSYPTSTPFPFLSSTTSQQDPITVHQTPNPPSNLQTRLLGHLATLLQLPHLFKSQSTLSERRQSNHLNHKFSSSVNPTPTTITMSTIVEKVSDAVNDVTAALGNTSISDKPADTTTTGDKDKSATNDAVLASAAEGRRLYIGNLAYATTEGELQAFFKGYLM